MGHLISRAFKRITQCSSLSRNTQNQREQQDDNNNNQAGTSTSPGRPVFESIPVGQSIDSAEYRALETNNKSSSSSEAEHKYQEPRGQVSDSNQPDEADEANAQANNLEGAGKQDVEEAVIKIQALVRGHLARKALKSGQHHSVPAANGLALGQSQFDEESLMKNPSSSFFLPSSPPHKLGTLDSQTNFATSQPSTRTPLESIAEMSELVSQNPPVTNGARQPSKQEPSQDEQAGEEVKEGEKKGTGKSRSAPSPSKLEMPPRSGSGGGLRSPALSEAAASIDLTCDSPASASIIISDHNIQGTDKLATVLHVKNGEDKNVGPLARSQPPPPRIDSPEGSGHDEGVDVAADRVAQFGTPDSLESEEAAAIRIQSAFRGYRTRKNSPYRTRSPSNSAQQSTGNPSWLELPGAVVANGGESGGKRHVLRQQEATDVPHEEDEGAQADGGESSSSAELAATAAGRRSSRPRQRDSLVTGQAKSGEEEEVAKKGAEEDEEVDVVEEKLVEGSDSVDRGLSRATILGAPSVEEFTTTDDTTTVKEVGGALAVQDQEELVSMKSGRAGSKDNNSGGDLGIPTKSGSMDADSEPEPLSNTLDDTGLSAALEAARTSTNEDELAPLNYSQSAQRASIGTKSEASMELDTDSSVLGAALSLNEDISVGEPAPGQGANSGPVAQGQQQRFDNLEPIEEDKSFGVSVLTDELESEVRRLVDEMNEAEEEPAVGADEGANKAHMKTGGCEKEPSEALELATNKLEAALEDATRDEVEADVPLPNEEEQRALEMESDDIERRDPRGQASEERAKSPQIITPEDAPQFGLELAAAAATLVDSLDGDQGSQERSDEPVVAIRDDDDNGNNDEHQEEMAQEAVTKVGHNIHLGVERPGDGEALGSGRSSPVFNSSSEADDSDNDNEAGNNNSHQRHLAESGERQKDEAKSSRQTTTTPPSKNKKKNRNKRRGKK